MCSFVYNKTTFYLPSRKNGDERFALSDSEGGVSRFLSVDPDQSRAATLFEKLDGAIKKETECIPKSAQSSRAISRSITKEFIIFEATGEKTANITMTTAAFESMPTTSVVAERDIQL